MTLKPGDKVWAACEVCALMPRGQTVIIGDLRDKDAGRFYQGIDHVIPDVPNLAHIAWFIADHPETVDALEWGAEALWDLSQANSHWKGIRDHRIDEPLANREIVMAFVRAMRGEGGHDAG